MSPSVNANNHADIAPFRAISIEAQGRITYGSCAIRQISGKPYGDRSAQRNSMLPNGLWRGRRVVGHKEKGPQGKGGKTYRPLATTRPGNASGNERHTAVRIVKSRHKHTPRVTRTLMRCKERTTGPSALCHTIDKIIWHFIRIEVSILADTLCEKRLVVLAWQQLKVQ